MSRRREDRARAEDGGRQGGDPAARGGSPEKLEDWPDGQAKYETFGGAEGDHSYDEGPETNLGPDSVRHHEDGSVEVGGEEVDDPDEFKGEPIPGGPTDPDAKSNPDEQRLASDEDDSGEAKSGEDES